jgi:hypothetical protein
MNFLQLLQIDATTVQTLFSLKDVSVTVILIAVCYYGYNKIEKLEAKNEELNKKMLEIQQNCLNLVNDLKEVIKDNTEAIKDLRK